MEDKKKGFFTKIRDRYRINIINPENFEEIASFNGSWLQVIMVLSVLFSFAFGLSVIVLAYTPLNNYFNSGRDIESDPYVVKLSMLADSLEKQIDMQARLIENHLIIAKGEDDIYSEDVEREENLPNQKVDERKLMKVSPEDSSLRKEMEASAYTLNQKTEKGSNNLHFYSPVNGIVNSTFDVTKQHFGVDIVAKKDAPVKATLDGTVIFSEYSSTTGNVIAIQHLNNIISVYKHNSVLLNSIGSFVRAGETIAIIGNSGENTSGPHLHFELWQNGQPVNPQNYIVF